MKEYLIVYSYAEEHYFDIGNEIVAAKNKKEAIDDFLEYKDKFKFKILNIIDLESEVNI